MSSTEPSPISHRTYVERNSDKYFTMLENGWKELHDLTADGKTLVKMEKTGVYGVTKNGDID